MTAERKSPDFKYFVEKQLLSQTESADVTTHFTISRPTAASELHGTYKGYPPRKNNQSQSLTRSGQARR